MLNSIRAHLAPRPDSASLESLSVLADRAVASENDVEEAKQGVVEIQVRLKKLKTVTTTAAKKKNYRHPHTAENRAPKTPFMPNVQARLYVPSNQNDNRQGFFTNAKQESCPNVPPPKTQQNNAVQPIDTTNAPVCYYHQTFGDKARTCREPCAFCLN